MYWPGGTGIETEDEVKKMLIVDPTKEFDTIQCRMEPSAYLVFGKLTGEKDIKGRPEYKNCDYSGEHKVVQSDVPGKNKLVWVGDKFWAPPRLVERWAAPANGGRPMVRVIGTRTEDEAKKNIDPTKTEIERPRRKKNPLAVQPDVVAVTVDDGVIKPIET